MSVGERWTYAIAVALVVGSLTYGIGGYPLLEPDEGRNAEVAREMAERNAYVVPRLNGLPYVDKPVLHFAATAALFELFGPTTVSARLPPLLFTIGTLVLVWWFGVRLTDRIGGFTAVIATATTPFTLAYSRTVIFDATLTFWVVLALVCFHESVERRQRGERVDLWRAGAWGAMAAGVLTKGPVALLLPLLVSIPYAVWRRQLRALVDPVAVLLLPALVVPWVAAVSREVPSFAGYVTFVETMSRLTNDQLGRSEPFWYFLAVLPAAALPWTVVLAARARELYRHQQARKGIHPPILFLLLWILVPLVFFSLANSKRPQYILPLIPGVGLLVAVAWHGLSNRAPGARAAAVALMLGGLGLFAFRGSIASMVSTTESVAAAIPWTAISLASACLVGGAVAWMSARWRPGAIVGLALPVAMIPFVSGDLMRAIGNDRSAEALSEAIVAEAPPDVQVVGVHVFPLSLPFYLGRTITLVTDDASELTSNYLTRYPAAWRRAPTVRPSVWWREAAIGCDRPRVFVLRVDDVSRRSVLDGHMAVLATSRKYVAYGPCGTVTVADRRQ